jgi:hypothetical protein
MDIDMDIDLGLGEAGELGQVPEAPELVVKTLYKSLSFVTIY